MRFAYQGCETGGHNTTGEVEALDLSDAIESLRRKGVFVSGINPAGKAVITVKVHTSYPGYLEPYLESLPTGPVRE